MTRTQVLQEIRRTGFKEAYGGWQERRLTQEEAARLLGVCERTFRLLPASAPPLCQHARDTGARWN